MSGSSDWFANTVLLWTVFGVVTIPITGSFVPLLLMVISLMTFRMIVPEL